MKSEKMYTSMLFIACFLIFIMETKVFHIEQNNQQWKITLEEFISHHTDYEIVIFCQDITYFENVSLMKLLPPAQIYTDLDLFSNIFISSEKSLNILLISNTDMEFGAQVKIFQKYSHNIFLTFETDEEYCTSVFAQLVPASFVLNLERNELFSCFDRKENPELTLILPNKMEGLNDFHRNFKNLRGRTLKIYHANYLSLRCRKDTPPDVCFLEGPDLLIIEALSQVLNFVPDIQRYHFKNFTTVWEDLLSVVNSGEADFVAGSVLVVANRTAYFTTYTWSSPLFGTLFVDPTREIGLWIITDTFDFSSYMVTTIVFVIFLVLMVISSYLENNQFDIFQNSLALMKAFVEQGTDINRIFNPTPTKYLFSLWLVLNIIISTSWKSILSSALIKPNTYGLTTSEDLAENRFWFVVDDWFMDFFKQSPYYNKIDIRDIYFVSFLNTENQCTDSTIFFRMNIALIHTEFSLVYLSRHCEKNYPIDKIQNLRFIKDDVTVYHAYPMRPDSPYRGVISKTIGRLHAAGLIQFWYWNITLESLRVKDIGYTFIKPLKIKHLFSFFMIFLGGLIVSAVIFTMELFIGKISRNKNKKSNSKFSAEL